MEKYKMGKGLPVEIWTVETWIVKIKTVDSWTGDS